jgi:NitT/TauT family transport system substrate-binding protein
VLPRPVPERRSRRAFLGGLTAATAATVAGVNAQGLKPLMLAEPAHNLGYLPLYLAMSTGLFAKRGIAVSLLSANGGAHVSALVAGQVWANIGGPESDAMANVGKADPLTTICNVVNRANNYMIAKKGLIAAGMARDQIVALMRGKRYAMNRFGGTPDILGRWYLAKLGIDAQKDVTIINQADSAAAPMMIKQNVADITITAEPQITYGKEMGIWDEPYFSFPSLGDYTYSVISVRKSTITNDPSTVQAFVDAMKEALHVVAHDRPTVEVAARKEFPTLPESGVKGALDRAYADHLWSPDGWVSEKGYNLDMEVVAQSGEFTKHVEYSSVVDMQFVKKSRSV